MYNITLTRCLVVLGVVLLFGVGYYFYNSHAEFSDAMIAYLQFKQTYLDAENVDADTSKHSPDNPEGTDDGIAVGKRDLSTDYKQGLETYSSKQKPVKVRIAETGMPDDVGVTTVPNEGPSKEYYKEDLIPQWVETPDGKVHKIYWFEKIKPGQAIPPPEQWSFADQVVVDGVVYDVPEDETADSYIDQIRLSTMYDVPLESVESLVEAGVIAGSPIEAESDPLFQDPHFVKRRDSRPLESRSWRQLSDWNVSDAEWAEREKPRPVNVDMVMLDGEMALIDAETGTVIMSGDQLDETEGGLSGETDSALDLASDQVPVADDSYNVLADMFEKLKPPQSMAAPENQLTRPTSDTKLAEPVSPESVNEAPTGIHQYSTEERLRHLEKVWVSDPEMARQFERHPPESPRSAKRESSISRDKQGENRDPEVDAPDSP